MVQFLAAIIITKLMGWQQLSIVGIVALLPQEEGGGEADPNPGRRFPVGWLDPPPPPPPGDRILRKIFVRGGFKLDFPIPRTECCGVGEGPPPGGQTRRPRRAGGRGGRGRGRGGRRGRRGSGVGHKPSCGGRHGIGPEAKSQWHITPIVRREGGPSIPAGGSRARRLGLLGPAAASAWGGPPCG